MCSKIPWSALSRRPGPAGTCLFPVAWLRNPYRVIGGKTACVCDLFLKVQRHSFVCQSVFMLVFKAWKAACVMVKSAPRRTG